MVDHYLLKGTTSHIRTTPKTHKFTYKVFYFCLDLFKLNSFTKGRLLTVNRKGIFSFWDRDHHLQSEKNVLEAAKLKIQDSTFEIKKAFLVTQLRTFGFIFNPVCFYMLINNKEEAYVIAEVMNTYYEHKSFISEKTLIVDDIINTSIKLPKAFYVSPYSSSRGEMEFQYKFNVKTKNFTVGVKNLEDKKLNVFADLKLTSNNLNKKTLFLAWLANPFITLKIWLGIHLQALILFLKRVPYYPKKQELEQQKGYDLWKI